MDILRKVIKTAIENNKIKKPSPLMIVGNSGDGKTTALRQFEDTPRVFYYSGSITPTKLHEELDEQFEKGNYHTFILDDLGKISEQKGTIEKVFSYLCGLCDGRQDYAQFETVTLNKKTNTVPILSCTPQWLSRKKIQTALHFGLSDRVLPFYFSPSENSKKSTLEACRFDSERAKLPQIQIDQNPRENVFPVDNEAWIQLKENFASERRLKIARRLWEGGFYDLSFVEYTKNVHEIDLDIVNPDEQKSQKREGK